MQNMEYQRGDSKIVLVPNVHSNFNQFLLKIELKIIKFQFLIYFSYFNFHFLTDIA